MGEASGCDTHSVFMSSLVCHTPFLVPSGALEIDYMEVLALSSLT